MGYEVHRYASADRYETAALIARRAYSAPSCHPVTDVAVACGTVPYGSRPRPLPAAAARPRAQMPESQQETKARFFAWLLLCCRRWWGSAACCSYQPARLPRRPTTPPGMYTASAKACWSVVGVPLDGSGQPVLIPEKPDVCPLFGALASVLSDVEQQTL